MRVPKYRSTIDGYGFVEYKRERHYLPGKYGSRESTAAYKRFVRDLASPSRPLPLLKPGRRVTVAQCLQRYLLHVDTWVDRHGNRTAEQFHVGGMARALIAVYPNLPMAEFGPKCLKAVREKIVVTNKVRAKMVIRNGKRVVERVDTGKPVTRRYVNDQVARIRRFFNWAVAEELVEASVADALSYLEPLRQSMVLRNGHKLRESKKVRPPSQAAIDAVLAHLSPTVKAMVKVQQLTGMRPAELCIMRPMDITRDDRIWEYRPESYKTMDRDQDKGLEKIVFLGPKSQAVLRPFLKREPESYLFSPRESTAWHNGKRYDKAKKSKGLPKTSRRVGENFTPASYRRAIRTAAVKAKAPHWFPYQLRHAHGTKVRKEYKLEGAQVALGHARADITQVYAERNLELARRIAAEIG